MSRRTAFAMVAVSLGMFIGLLPLARIPLPATGWFIPMVQSVLVVNDAITATLLFGHTRLTRRPAVLVLGCAYLFSALAAAMHMLTFPGVFGPAGALGGGAQTTAYLHVFWHAGFALLVIAYALLKARPPTHAPWGPWTLKAALATGVAVAALGLLATAGNDLLPPILQGIHYSSSFNIGRYGQWLAVAAALAVLWRRRQPSALDLWLTVVLAASFFEIALVSIFNAGRYDVGFYAGRLYALLASSFVLVMLLTEHGRMFRDLAHAEQTARWAAALRDSREVLQLAMHGGRMGAWSHDLVSERAWWSPELEQILGLPVGTLGPHAQALPAHVHRDDRERLLAAMRTAIDRHEEFAVELRLASGDGARRWVEARGRAKYDEAGKPATLLGVVVDITQRKTGEEAAAEMEARFRALADGMPKLAWMARADGWIYWYNRRWFEYTGTTLAQMQGWGWQSVHDPAALPAVIDTFRRSLATGEPWEMTFPLRGADGRLRPFLTRMLPLKDDEGRVQHWFGTNTDITAQREAEEALRCADQRKDEFLATLAHELRNPLAPIRNAVAIMARADRLPPSLERAREVIDRQSRHLTRLVDDLLEVARITQGKVNVRHDRLSVVDCVRDALHAVEPTLEAMGHTLEADLGDDPLVASGDPTRLAQCVVNLLNNAVKFTPSGGRIAVGARREGDTGVVRVRDNGIGIAAEHLDSIFGMFSQVTPSLQRSQGGLGIGLALVRGLVELHGGTVQAASDGPGRGCEFTIRLPLAQGEPQAAAEPAPAPAPPPAPVAAPTLPLAGDVLGAAAVARRILVVDDNEDVAISLRSLLESSGHQVQVAHDGPLALRLAFEFEPEVILLDLGMPTMSGLDVARALRRRAGGADMLVVAITGWGQDKDRRLTAEAGFDVHLTKPVDHGELEAVIATRAPPRPRHAHGPGESAIRH
jgi:PAS domain S-box-containing protein